MALIIMVDEATTIRESFEDFCPRERFAGFLQFLVLLGNMVRAESDKSSWLGENVRRL